MMLLGLKVMQYLLTELTIQLLKVTKFLEMEVRSLLQRLDKLLRPMSH